MLSACYFCLIFVKIGIYLQILVKIRNMEFYENLHWKRGGGAQVLHCTLWTDERLIVTFYS
jgi:hypothetical protein